MRRFPRGRMGVPQKHASRASVLALSKPSRTDYCYESGFYELQEFCIACRTTQKQPDFTPSH